MRRNKILWVILSLCLVLCACSSNSINSTQSKETSLETSLSHSISFVDDDGSDINLEKPAQRIISFYSAHTENLYYIGAGSQVIGGHKTCVFPAESAKTAVYDYNGDAEYVIAAEPDLVLIRPFISKKAPDFIKELKNAGITVVSLYPESYEEFPQYIRKLALLTGRQDEAEKMLEKFYEDIEAVKAKTSNIEEKHTVFLESTETNLRTVGKGSMPAIALEYSGGINIAKDIEANEKGGSIASFGVEKVLENSDNIDVYISQRGAMNAGGSIQSIKERPGFDTIKAVKNDKIFVIDEKIISSPTFRFYKGIKEVSRFLYPEVMDDVSEFRNDEKATKESFSEIIVKMAHMPIYLPSSSKYYNEERDTHYFGRFKDVSFKEESFDYIETAVYRGLIGWEKQGEEEIFSPYSNVTREQLAKAVFLINDFKTSQGNFEIKDIELCDKPRIIETLVANEIFQLDEGNFQPERLVSNNEIVNAVEKALSWTENK